MCFNARKLLKISNLSENTDFKVFFIYYIYNNINKNKNHHSQSKAFFPSGIKQIMNCCEQCRK